MGAAKTKNTSWFSRNKTVVFILVGSFVVLVLLGFLYYQSQRPNYRDLEKEFSTLQIPADWELVSESSSKGWKGLFCFTAKIDETCPYLEVNYQNSVKLDPDSDKKLLTTLASEAGYSTSDVNYENCNLSAEKYYCILFAEKNGINARLSVSSVDNEKLLTIRFE